MASTENIAQLMAEFRQGNKDAAARLTEPFYPELRRIAALRMKKEAGQHTWQPTVLVNELYLELLKVGRLPAPASEAPGERDSFLNFAAFLMKRILIQLARPLARRVHKVSLETAIQPAVAGESLMELEDVLSRLGRINPSLRSLVEIKVFEGLSREAIAERLGCTTRTVTRRWEFAKTWLQHELAGDASA